MCSVSSLCPVSASAKVELLLFSQGRLAGLLKVAMGLTCQDAEGRGPREGFAVSLCDAGPGPAHLGPAHCWKLPSSLPGGPLLSEDPGFPALEPGLSGGVIPELGPISDPIWLLSPPSRYCRRWPGGRGGGQARPPERRIFSDSLRKIPRKKKSKQA